MGSGFWGPKGLSLCLVPWAGPSWQEVPPCKGGKGHCCHVGPAGRDCGCPTSVTAWCELLKSAPVWERRCQLRTRRPFLQLRPQQERDRTRVQQGLSLPPVSQPAHPGSRSSQAQAAPPASPEFQPRRLPPAAVHTTQVPPFIALGRNFIVSRDLLTW